ncbi:MAG: 16S rRNA (adenine(1518)-N(6)/adenine(1519)-N(6))-dimethyltransferase RsmA [Desulfitobacteriia bacterium]
MASVKQETTAEYTRRVLKSGARAKKHLGQNFLIDDDIIERIVEEGIPDPDLPVLEIGPGPGGLTRALLSKVKKLWLAELDKEKVEILEKEFSPQMLDLKGFYNREITILQIDALKLQLLDLWGREKGYLIGNLPYYITNPLLSHFLEQKDYLLGLTVMVQKEVGERMLAIPGGKDYGILSIAVQLAAEPTKLFDVPPSAFWPQPKVTSSVLQLRIRPYPGFIVNSQEYFRVVRAAFAQRRKTLTNSLAAGLGLSKAQIKQVLKAANLEENLRAENLSLIDYQNIVLALRDLSS